MEWLDGATTACSYVTDAILKVCGGDPRGSRFKIEHGSVGDSPRVPPSAPQSDSPVSSDGDIPSMSDDRMNVVRDSYRRALKNMRAKRTGTAVPG